MTASSIWTARVQYDESQHARDRPLSGSLGLQLANNAKHYADQAGQVRAAWRARAGESITPERALSTGWVRVISIGPFPLFLGKDGDPFFVRVRLAGHSSDGSQIILGAVLAAPGAYRPYAGGSFGIDNWVQYTTTSTTDAWRTEDSGTTLLTLRQRELSSEHLSVLDSVGGNRIARSVAMTELVIVAQEDATGATAKTRLTGWYAAEHTSD